MAKISGSTIFTASTFAIGFLIPALGFLFPETFFSNQQQITNFIKSFGWWTPIIFIGLSIIPIVFTPLNHTIFGIVGGFVFGPWVGFLLNWISKTVGTLISFSIGRSIGQRAVKKFAKSEHLEQYNKIFTQHPFIIFVGFTVNDTLSYLAGISSMKLRAFVPLILLAHIIPTLTLSYIGSGISLTDPLFIGLVFVILLIALIYFYLKRKKEFAAKEQNQL